MKSTTIACFLLLQTSAWATRKDITVEYRDLHVQNPGDLMKPNPYQYILYSPAPAVVRMSDEFLPEFARRGPKNAIFSNVAEGKVEHVILDILPDTTHTETFTPKRINFGCAHRESNGSTTTVDCKVRFVGTSLAGGHVQRPAQGSRFSTFHVTFPSAAWEKIVSLKIIVLSAGSRGEIKDGLSVVVDRFEYEVDVDA